MLLIDRDMAVHTVQFTQDDRGGTETTLDLVPPESLTSDPPAASSTGSDSGEGGDGEAEPTSDTAWNSRSTGVAV
jgi:hypothetical protein